MYKLFFELSFTKYTFLASYSSDLLISDILIVKQFCFTDISRRLLPLPSERALPLERSRQSGRQSERERRHRSRNVSDAAKDVGGWDAKVGEQRSRL